jgi:beta-phosphoglucomutase-like phosphatase (HAD superfamily)
MSGEPVQAVLFDLDGTLVDSETHTDTAIRRVAQRHGVAGFALPPAETRGRTWTYIASFSDTGAESPSTSRRCRAHRRPCAPRRGASRSPSSPRARGR